MSYINNMNPRRMIWFNQNAPKNKMDLWLSYNRHYEDTSDDETTETQQIIDNPGLRNCDLILKAWDCGRWVPIVGFNTTAGNKINIVTGVDYTVGGHTYSGKTLYHPAIFTDQSPSELFDYGTVADVLEGLVSENEWQSIINNGGLGEAIEYYIESGDIEIPFATTTKIGGILSDTHGRIPDESYRFYPIECMFYPDYQQYESKQGRLCTNAYEIKVALNYVDNVLYDEDPTSELIVNGWKGVLTEMRDDHSGVWVRANVENVESGTPHSSLSITNSTVSGQEDSIVITGTDYTKVVGPYEVFDYQTSIDSYSFDFSQIQSFKNTNPIYLIINAKSGFTITSGTKYICDTLEDNSITAGKYLVTIQFGIVKFEKINTAS